MTAVSLLPTTIYTDLVEALHTAGALDTQTEPLVVQVPPDCFISSDALAFLAAWGVRELRNGRRIRFFGKAQDLRYLSRIDLFKHLDVSYEEKFDRQPEEGRFVPIRLIEGIESVGPASHAICDVVLSQFDNAREFLPAMEWAAYEIIDNVRLHSSSRSPGAVVAQYFPQQHRLDIAICDVGRGIFASLSESRKLWSHGDAITRALMRGVTRDPEVGQGNGLAGSLEIMKVNGGQFQLWSGDVLFKMNGGKKEGFKSVPEVSGTGVFFQLDTRRPVRLNETFISRVADGDWSYLNYAAERIEEKGSIRVIDRCSNTGSREAARPLRRTIEALLPEMTTPMVLDFFGVEFASSSFLDELLGRLAASMGADRFHEQLLIRGAEQTISDMANVVIRQRLEGEMPPDVE